MVLVCSLPSPPTGGTGGASAPKTTGSGFSFPTLTTSTAGGTSGGGFSFGTALASQTLAASPFSFGTTPAATTTTASTGGLFSTPTPSTQPPASTSGLFLGTPASSTASSFNFSGPAATTTGGGFTGFQLPTSTPASTSVPTSTPTLQFGGPTKPQGAAPEPAKSAAPTLQTAFFSSPKPAGMWAWSTNRSLCFKSQKNVCEFCCK